MIKVLLFGFVGLAYALLIWFITRGWLRLPVFWPSVLSEVKLSVIVPARNEEGSIKSLLESLCNQNYPRELYEVIVVNDHCTDSTGSIVQSFIKGNKLPNFSLINGASYYAVPRKKNALEFGIRHARFNYIVTTDADCIMGRHWLQTIACFLVQEKADMVIGQVSIIPGRSLFSQFQALEFMSLTGATAGAARQGHPILCNGANLIFRKEIFEKTGGYLGNYRYESGDDMFLLHKFKKINGIRILPIKSHGAMVFTLPKAGISEFLKQRGRWAGKAPGYNDKATIITGLVVACVNIMIVLGMVSVFFSPVVFAAAFFLLIFKGMVDFPLMWSVSGFLGNRRLLWLYPALLLVYPIYVTVVLAKGIFFKPGWKL
ncbi:MAG TPA: glycosyltransferase [Bacteroidales bacterium]|nr:glycosyltransferase [Bacteroidales bacterium]